MWVIKHSSICHTFVDEGAGVFFLPHLHTSAETSSTTAPVKRVRYEAESVPRVRRKEAEREEEEVVRVGVEEMVKRKVVEEEVVKKEGVEEEEVKEREGADGGVLGAEEFGSALGPDWPSGRTMRGKSGEVCSRESEQREIETVTFENWQ